MAGVPLSWSVPAFGFSESMTRPVNKSPLDTRQLYSGTNYAAQDEAARQARITNFNSYTSAHPGAAAGGTGDTGLAPTDAAGWSQLLERQQQNLKDVAAESGKAAPTVRIGAYDGSNFSTAGATKMPSASAGAALKALSGLSGSSNEDDGGPSRFIRQDPDLYKAYTNALLDQLQSAGREARVAGMSPAEHAVELGDTRINDVNAVNREFERGQGDLDTMQEAASKFHAYDSYGRPIAEDTARIQGDLADVKGKAATYDDLIRTAAQRDVAGINAGVQDRRTQSQAAMNGLNAAQRDQANVRQFGGQVSPQIQGQIQAPGLPGAAPAPAPGGAAGGGKPIPKARVLQIQQQNGWDDATTQRMLQQYGYTVTP
jgi:hypothetical protein